MKVISGPTEWSTERTCSSCKATVRVDIKDVRIACLDGDYLDRGTDHVVAYCCVCGTMIRLFDCYKSPPLVLAAARANRIPASYD